MIKFSLNQREVDYGYIRDAESFGGTYKAFYFSTASYPKALCTFSFKEAWDHRIGSLPAHEGPEGGRTCIWGAVRTSHPLSAETGFPGWIMLRFLRNEAAVS